MKKILLTIALFLAMITSYAIETYDNGSENNPVITVIDLEANATSHILKVITRPMNINAEIKIIDEAGAILFQDKFHIDKEIDVSGLKNGLYLVKVYTENYIAVKRFYKRRDGVNVK